MQHQVSTPVLKGKFTTARIVRRLDLTVDLWRIWLQPAEPFPFKPGQYCTIGASGIERPYSIASPPAEPEIELFIEHIPLPVGQLTPLLYKLKVGDQVTLRPRAKGLFFFNEGFRNHVMVATVTGVAPYLSILRTQLAKPRAGDRYFVLEGASHHDEFGYDAELREMAAAHPDRLKFIPSVSRPQDPRNSGWKGATGRINALVDGYLREFALPRADTCVYLCGHPLMIEDVKRRLDGSGYHIEEERFWKEDEGGPARP
jgi:ferredoxin-NADP reductase